MKIPDLVVPREVGAFFTPNKWAREAILYLHREGYLREIEGTPKLLEPSVGCGSFIRASDEISGALDLDWVTNEMYPQLSKFKPDFEKNFLELTPEEVGPIDIVLGNPPFGRNSNHVEWKGRKIPLWAAFVDHALDFADTVGFYLPATVMRNYYQAYLPSRAEIAFGSEPVKINFEVGQDSDEVANVRCSFFVFKKSDVGVDYSLKLDPIPGFEWTEGEDATHALQQSNGAKIRDLSVEVDDPELRRWKPFADEYKFKWVGPECELWSIQCGWPFEKYVTEFRSGPVWFCRDEFVDYLNRWTLPSLKRIRAKPNL